MIAPTLHGFPTASRHGLRDLRPIRIGSKAVVTGCMVLRDKSQPVPPQKAHLVAKDVDFCPKKGPDRTDQVHVEKGNASAFGGVEEGRRKDCWSDCFRVPDFSDLLAGQSLEPERKGQPKIVAWILARCVTLVHR